VSTAKQNNVKLPSIHSDVSDSDSMYR